MYWCIALCIRAASYSTPFVFSYNALPAVRGAVVGTGVLVPKFSCAPRDGSAVVAFYRFEMSLTFLFPVHG